MDGRTFRNPGASRLLAEQRRSGLNLPIGVNHATQLSIGAPAPAYGWITDYAEQDGALMGHVELNAHGRAALEARDYRYYLPAYVLSAGGQMEIRAVESIGLCNIPNSPSYVLSTPRRRHERDREGPRPARDGDRVVIVAAINNRGQSPP